MTPTIALYVLAGIAVLVLIPLLVLATVLALSVFVAWCRNVRIKVNRPWWRLW